MDSSEMEITGLPSFHTREELEALVLEGLNSGPPIEVTEEYWEQKLRVLEQKIQEAHRPPTPTRTDDTGLAK